MRLTTSLYLILLLLISNSCSDNTSKNELAKHVTIYRDNWGIPHVHGETDAATIFGLAYAYAEDYFPLIEENAIEALGRLSEVSGVRDSLNLFGAIKFHAFEVESRAKLQYQRLNKNHKEIVDSFADGLNYYLKTHPEEEVKLIQEFEPWFFLAADIYSEQHGWLDEDQGAKPPEIRPAITGSKRMSRGSNGWAISPLKTATGNSMLLINPHDPHADPYYECHIISDEGLNFYGVMPYWKLSVLPMAGFNDDLGFTLTVNNKDVQDAYLMTFDDTDDDLKYKFDEDYLTAEELVFDIKIKDGDSSYYSTHRIKKTIHGPVFKDSEGREIAYRLAENDSVTLLEQQYRMIKATDFDSWKSAVDLNAKIHHNLTYADKDGNIYYLFNGRIPKRDTSFDWSKPVDGSNPNTLWQGYHSIDELPQLFNPSTGYVQNCNQSPFLTTHNENPSRDDFPEYMWKLNAGPTARSERAMELLSEAERMNLDSLYRLNFDTYNSVIGNYIQMLQDEFQDIKETNSQRYKKLEDAVNMMSSWDMKSNAESIPAGMLVAWADAFVLSFNPETDQEPPSQLDIFELALDLLENEFGTWKVPYGKLVMVQRSPEGDYGIDPNVQSYPTDGNTGGFGTMFCMSYPDYNGKSLVRRVDFGNSFVAHVEFTPQGPSANSLLSYGNSGRTNSTHYSDQTEMFARGKMKKVNYTMDDISNNLEEAYKPGEPRTKH